MAAVGGPAPSFQLQDREGKEHSLRAIWQKGAILAFFKVSCPTCQLAFPLLERAAAQGLRIVGISQDSPQDTQRFQARLGITFPLLIDPAEAGYPVSIAYGLEYVPTLVVVNSSARIETRVVAFDKAAYAALGVPFLDTDQVPLYKPG